MPYLFQRFHRHRAGGSGIGLAVVKALVEAQGGRAWAESRVGQGSTFYFTLPLAEAK
jgi:signal transduction histidine kinase